MIGNVEQGKEGIVRGGSWGGSAVTGPTLDPVAVLQPLL